MYHMGGALVLWALLWGLIGLALLVLIIVAIIWLIRQLVTSSRTDPAEEVLRRRFAAGEIDQEEYQRRRSELHER